MNFLTAKTLELGSEKCQKYCRIMHFREKYNNIVNRKNFSELPLFFQLSYLLNLQYYNLLWRECLDDIETQIGAKLNRIIFNAEGNFIIYE